MRASLGTVVFLALASTSSALADATEARCDIYPAGSDHTDKMIGCTFSQRQGYVTITRQDGVTHRLTPANDQPAVYRDQHGSEVRRVRGLTPDGHRAEVRILPEHSPVANYAFDVTPARLVTGLITERGVCEASAEGLLGLYPERR